MAHVDIICSPKIAAAHLPSFWHSFQKANFKYSEKSYILEQEKVAERKSKNEEIDPRQERFVPTVDSIEIHHQSGLDAEKDEWKFVKAAIKSTNLAATLTDTRGTHADCNYMEEAVHKVIKEAPQEAREKVSVEIIKGQELLDRGFGLFHAVGRCAKNEPRYIAVHYKGNPDSTETEVAFIGKGITYDTGGLSLKPTAGMVDMYCDKGGACAIVGSMCGALELCLK